ncbi:MAG: 50S ribosomal protein L32 [Deltaproteobacteria bacterium]|nr:50S ribosomal protein L32 [Deltaproteobacteria bacterium]
MQAPKKRVSKSRKNMRRAHDGLTVVGVSKCKNCGGNVRSHTVCGECGFYRGRFFISARKSAAAATQES